MTVQTERFRGWIFGVLSVLLAAFAVPSMVFAQQVIETPRGPGMLIYGNYCGPGNRGPGFGPIDALDQACAHHDACWPTAPGVLPSCACNARLHREAGAVARSPATNPKTRQMAQFISDFADAIPCDDGSLRGVALPAPRLPAAR